MTTTTSCRAKDPANCRYHGTQFSAKYQEHVDAYNATGAVPKVLFSGTTVAPKINTAELVEYGNYPESNIQSFGFPPYKGEDVDLAAYIEIPYYDNRKSEIAAVTRLWEAETNPVKKARYQSIRTALSRRNADNELLDLERQNTEEYSRITHGSSYETGIADAHIIYQYGKAVESHEELDSAEKAIVLFESLKKNQGTDWLDIGEFGSKSYQDIVKDTWETYARTAEIKERRK
jgi:hypothetical protein